MWHRRWARDVGQEFSPETLAYMIFALLAIPAAGTSRRSWWLTGVKIVIAGERRSNRVCLATLRRRL
jgi:hypothetical protein